MNDATGNSKRRIYPTECQFKIIAFPNAQASIEDKLDEIGFPKPVTTGRTSRSGKYITYHAAITVHSRNDIEIIYEGLRSLQQVKTVL